MKKDIDIVSIMDRAFRGMCLVAGVVALGVTVMAQNIGIVVQALDGRNGMPLANQHLLVFTGASEDAAKSHAVHTGLTTDKNGFVTLTISTAETRWIQVWADGHVLCQPKPNENSFSVGTIMKTGLAAPNTCSSLSREVAPGHFIVFARPAHFMEKMRQ